MHIAQGRAVVLDMRAQDVPEALVPSFANQVQIHFSHRGQIVVRVINGDGIGVVLHFQTVVRHVTGLERLQDRARSGQAVLVSLHDLTLAARFADRVVVLNQAGVVADGAPTEALSPDVMARVFGLTARWIAGSDGPLLAAGRRQSAG